MPAESFVPPGTARYPKGSEFETVYVQKKAEFWGYIAFVFGCISVVAILVSVAFAPGFIWPVVGIFTCAELLLILVCRHYWLTEHAVREQRVSQQGFYSSSDVIH